MLSNIYVILLLLSLLLLPRGGIIIRHVRSFVRSLST